MSIYKKLFEAKKEIGKISKDSKNPFFKSKYFDINSLLEHVEPILQKHGLLLLQPITENKVTTEIIDVDGQDGEVCIVSSEIQLQNITDPQKLGSAITYYRRYTLQSLLGLQAEDDDGNKASRPASPKLDVTRLNTRLNACKTLSELQDTYLSFSKAEQKATVGLKDELKTKLT